MSEAPDIREQEDCPHGSECDWSCDQHVRNPQAIYVLQVQDRGVWWTQTNYSWPSDEEGKRAADQKSASSVLDTRVALLTPTTNPANTPPATDEETTQ